MFCYLPADAPQNRSVAIVAGQTALLLADLPSDAWLARLTVLARTVGFDNMLDELRSQSEAAFQHFALLWTDPVNARVRVAVGGQATAKFDSFAVFTSPGQSATTELHMSQVAQVRLNIAPIPSSVPFALPLADGVVQTSTLVWGRDDTAIESVEEPPVVSVPAVTPAPALVPAPEPAAALVAPMPDLAAPAPVPTPPVQAPIAPAETPAEPPAANFFDQLFGQTRFRDVEAAAIRDTGASEAEAPAPAPAPAKVDAPPEAAAQAQPQPQPQPREISNSLSATYLTHDPLPSERVLGQSGPPALVLVLPNGTAEPLDRAILVGRKPAAPLDAGSRSFGLVAVGQRNSGLSRNHLRVEPHQGGATVTDLGSTNGTVLVRASGESIALQPHTSLLAHAGDQLILGTTIVVSIATQQ